MAILKEDLDFPMRIGTILAYRLEERWIMRELSGFTTEALQSDAKYEPCRQTAREFGRLSKLCKALRLALTYILPKQNNLAVVNSLNSKMRQVLAYDTTNGRGERHLAIALATSEGKQVLLGYEFNPDTTIRPEYRFTETSLLVRTKGLVFPDGSTHVGFRMHQLVFDFTTAGHEVTSTDWVIARKTKLPETITLPLLEKSTAAGVAFTVLETQGFRYTKDSYVPFTEGGGKSVMITAVV